MEYQVHKQGKRVFLRPLSLEDSPLVVRWRNNPRVRENYIYREPFTLEGQEAYYRDVIQAGKAVQAVICEKENRYAGRVLCAESSGLCKKAV